MKSRQAAVRGSALPKEELKRPAEFPDARIIMLTTFDGDVEVLQQRKLPGTRRQTYPCHSGSVLVSESGRKNRPLE